MVYSKILLSIKAFTYHVASGAKTVGLFPTFFTLLVATSPSNSIYVIALFLTFSTVLLQQRINRGDFDLELWKLRNKIKLRSCPFEVEENLSVERHFHKLKNNCKLTLTSMFKSSITVPFDETSSTPFDATSSTSMGSTFKSSLLRVSVEEEGVLLKVP